MAAFLRIYDQHGTRHDRDFDEPMRVNGRVFRVVKRMVGGGNGDIFLCEELNLGNRPGQFALKVLTQNRDNRIGRFLNEIEVLSILSHPNILPAIGSGWIRVDEIEVPWLLMELGGFNMAIHVNGNPNAQIPASGPVVGAHFKTLALQMCDAVDHLHSHGYIHRDIKPANFVWTRKQGNSSVSLIDFGLCKKVEGDTTGRSSDTITLDNETVGPRMLFSPELCQYAIDKETPVDKRSDLWQLSRVFWFMATGILSTGRPARRVDPFGGALHDIADRMCHDDPDDRMQTIDELRTAIDSIVT